MKSIKPLLLVSFSLSIVFTVQAQQPEEKTIKPLPAALTKSPATDEKSALIPAPKEIKADAVQAAPSPLTREDGTKANETENITLKAVAVDTKGATNQLTPEQIKTLNGTGTLPKQSAIAPGTENSKPLPLSKPVIAKEQ
jgi:hypothetical protein